MLEDDDRYITMIRETRAPIRADAIISIVNMLVEANTLTASARWKFWRRTAITCC